MVFHYNSSDMQLTSLQASFCTGPFGLPEVPHLPVLPDFLNLFVRTLT
jgi:hypothetical protein